MLPALIRGRKPVSETSAFTSRANYVGADSTGALWRNRILGILNFICRSRSPTAYEYKITFLFRRIPLRRTLGFSLGLRGKILLLFAASTIFILAATAFSFWQFYAGLRTFEDDVMVSQNNRSGKTRCCAEKRRTLWRNTGPISSSVKPMSAARASA
jgi:hypothetical protein